MSWWWCENFASRAGFLSSLCGLQHDITIFDSGYFRCIVAKLCNLYSRIEKDDQINYKPNRLRCASPNMLRGFDQT